MEGSRSLLCGGRQQAGDGDIESGGIPESEVPRAVMSALANNAEKREPSEVLGGTSAVPQAQLRADREFAL